METHTVPFSLSIGNPPLFPFNKNKKTLKTGRGPPRRLPLALKSRPRFTQVPPRKGGRRRAPLADHLFLLELRGATERHFDASVPRRRGAGRWRERCRGRSGGKGGLFELFFFSVVLAVVVEPARGAVGVRVQAPPRRGLHFHIGLFFALFCSLYSHCRARTDRRDPRHGLHPPGEARTRLRNPGRLPPLVWFLGQGRESSPERARRRGAVVPKTCRHRPALSARAHRGTRERWFGSCAHIHQRGRGAHGRAGPADDRCRDREGEGGRSWVWLLLSFDFLFLSFRPRVRVLLLLPLRLHQNPRRRRGVHDRLPARRRPRGHDGGREASRGRERDPVVEGRPLLRGGASSHSGCADLGKGR